MTLKEKLEFLAKHSDGSSFETQNDYGYWIVVDFDRISFATLYSIQNREFREIEMK